MYTPQKTTLSADSYTILNAIRNSIGGEFKAMTPLVKTADDAKEYGLYVTGAGDTRNQFMTALVNRIAAVMCLVRSYENPLKRYKKGVLGPGEMVENVWVGLVLPEGWSQSPVSPGDVYKTNNPENKATFHPVNSKLVYEVTTNEAELSLAFTSETGVYDLVSRIVQRLTDSSEWDEYIMTKYVIARAILANSSAIKKVAELSAGNSDKIVTSMKGVSNNMRFMGSKNNIAGVPTHSPIDKQIFFLTADTSAVIDVNSLANAFNIEYKQFLGQQQMINSFTLTDEEQARLDVIMSETVAQGLVPNYTQFTEEEVETLSHIVAATIDEDFFMIFDKLYQVNALFDQLHLNTNTFLHNWKVYSYNPFANCVFYSDQEEITVPSVELSNSTLSLAIAGDATLVATTVPAGETVTWTSSDSTVATVSDGVVTGVAAGTATITATITVDGTDYSATCSVVVTGE